MGALEEFLKQRDLMLAARANELAVQLTMQPPEDGAIARYILNTLVKACEALASALKKEEKSEDS